MYATVDMHTTCASIRANVVVESYLYYYQTVCQLPSVVTVVLFCRCILRLDTCAHVRFFGSFWGGGISGLLQKNSEKVIGVHGVNE